MTRTLPPVKRRSVRPPRRGRLAPLVLLLALGVALAGLLPTGRLALAQASDPAWSEPANLSQSGGAAEPHLAADSSGTLHAVWKDLYAGLVYVRGEGGQWSAPEMLSLPFEAFDFELRADAAGWLHAFWIDDERVLFHQRVRAQGADNSAEWLAPVSVATDVGAFAVALTADDQWHLAFARVRQTATEPAGIYALRSAAGAATWQAPEPIFLSPYFRTLVPPDTGQAAALQTAQAHVDVATAEVNGATWVVVAWDHPALHRVAVARSEDGGASWGPALEVDGPTASAPYKQPEHIRVMANGREIVVVWRASLAGGTCSLAYRTSDDGGDTWSPIGPVLPAGQACPESLQVLPLPGGQPLLLGSDPARAYLLAWDGARWSAPQQQPTLTGFVSPAAFTFVQVGCLGGAVSSETLYVVGCELGGNGDIWATSRALPPVDEWFAPPTGWSVPVVADLGTATVQALSAASGPGLGLEALWSQASPDTSGQLVSHGLFVASWHTGQVTGPFPVLTNLAQASREVVTAIDPNGRLLAFWVGGEDDALYFSWADAVTANSASSWTPPEALSEDNGRARSPRVVVDAAGSITLLYVVPLNEDRGLYVRQSHDRGATWSPADQVVDGAAEGCALVEQPGLVAGADGALVAQWVCATLPGGAGPLALYQARSDDGRTWSAAEQVVDQPVIWSQLAAAGSGQLHRVWHTPRAGGVAAWHAMSVDGGRTWSRAANIGLTDGATGQASLAADAAGGLHLLQVAESAAGAALSYWAWDGQTWALGDPVALGEGGPVMALSAGVDGTGQLAAVYARTLLADATGASATELGMVARAIVTAAGDATAPARLTPPAPSTSAGGTPTAITPIPTRTPAPTSTRLPAGTGSTGVPSGRDGGLAPSLLAGALSAIVVVGVALAGALRAKQRA